MDVIIKKTLGTRAGCWAFACGSNEILRVFRRFRAETPFYDRYAQFPLWIIQFFCEKWTFFRIFWIIKAKKRNINILTSISHHYWKFIFHELRNPKDAWRRKLLFEISRSITFYIEKEVCKRDHLQLLINKWRMYMS